MERLVIIIIIAVLIGVLLFRRGGFMEGMVEGLTSDEAIKNIASVYNTDKMAVTNLDVTGEAVANSVRATKLWVGTDMSNNPAYNNDAVNALNDLNKRLTDLTDRVLTVETNYVDKRKPSTINGTGGTGAGLIWGSNVKIVQ